MRRTFRKLGYFADTAAVKHTLQSVFSCAHDADGDICFRSGTGSFAKQTFLSVERVLNDERALWGTLSCHNAYDAFFSFATYRGGNHQKRTTSQLLNIYAWSIDVDYPNTNADPRDVLQYLLENVPIPAPNYAECGHRLRLVYLFREPLRLFPKQRASLLRGYTFLQECVCRIINSELSFGGYSFGAESNPPTSFFRIPGSINSKDGSVIEVLPLSEERFTLREFLEEFVPDNMLDASGCKDAWFAKWKKSPKKKKNTALSTQALWERRLTTLEKMRSGGNVHRRKMCFVYACGLVHAGKASSPQELEDLVQKFNEGFAYPLRPNQVYSQIRRVFEKPYKFTDEYLRIYLEAEGNVFSGVSKKVSDHERYLRKKARMEKTGNTKAQKIDKRRTAVAHLLEENVSVAKIAEILQVSLSTIKRDVSVIQRTKKVPVLSESTCNAMPTSCAGRPHISRERVLRKIRKILGACKKQSACNARDHWQAQRNAHCVGENKTFLRNEFGLWKKISPPPRLPTVKRCFGPGPVSSPGG